MTNRQVALILSIVVIYITKSSPIKNLWDLANNFLRWLEEE